MEEQLIELQTQISFQEHTINELNSALTSQQQQIDKLVRELQLFKEHMDEVIKGSGEAIGTMPNERPPHY